MTQVSIIRCPNYHPEVVNKCVREAVDLIGGMSKFVKTRMRVLIKPNLLSDKPSESMVNTHPTVIKAVVDLVIQHGGIPCIGDTPGISSLTKVVQKSGLTKFINQDIFLPDFSQYILTQTPKDYIFKEFNIAKEVLEADLVINLPKIKTHAQMLLTLAVKNLFGCIPKHDRIQWHLRAGMNRYFFATMLVELYSMIRPGLTIVDGVIGMEGNGPESGTPRNIGVIVAGIDCLAIDTVICHILGIDSQNLYTIQAAQGRNIGKTSLDEINIVGKSLNQVKINNFQLPPELKITAWRFFIPKKLRIILKQHLIPKPVINPAKCNSCLICFTNCPPKVITIAKKKLIIDYTKCIRCFCCQEFCPQGAITIKEGWLCRINLLRRIIDTFLR